MEVNSNPQKTDVVSIVNQRVPLNLPLMDAWPTIPKKELLALMEKVSFTINLKLPIPEDKDSSIEISEGDLMDMLLAGEYEELFKIFIHDSLLVCEVITYLLI
jgi:hypothetical protein